MQGEEYSKYLKYLQASYAAQGAREMLSPYLGTYWSGIENVQLNETAQNLKDAVLNEKSTTSDVIGQTISNIPSNLQNTKETGKTIQDLSKDPSMFSSLKTYIMESLQNATSANKPSVVPTPTPSVITDPSAVALITKARETEKLTENLNYSPFSPYFNLFTNLQNNEQSIISNFSDNNISNSSAINGTLTSELNTLDTTSTASTAISHVNQSSESILTPIAPYISSLEPYVMPALVGIAVIPGVLAAKNLYDRYKLRGVANEALTPELYALFKDNELAMSIFTNLKKTEPQVLEFINQNPEVLKKFATETRLEDLLKGLKSLRSPKHRIAFFKRYAKDNDITFVSSTASTPNTPQTPDSNPGTPTTTTDAMGTPTTGTSTQNETSGQTPKKTGTKL